ncbi:MAG: sugar transporter substrate-binding protein [Conexibacter sp.]|jgi:ribose transport system substrate-binding protein|nr:sugar transporter substrate-binding protein [Conexibacter sp.]
MRALTAGALGTALLALVSAGCGSDSSSSSGAGSGGSGSVAVKAPTTAAAEVLPTGPSGEKGVSAATLKLTPDQIDKLKATANGRPLRVATFWQASVDNTTNMINGIKETFRKYGLPITISAQAMANWDAAKQATQIQTLVNTKPDAMIGILVDQSAEAPAIRMANKAKIPVVFWDVPATGEPYSGIVTSNGRLAGWRAADAMAKAMGGKGDVAVLPMKIKFFPTDQRVDGFVERIKQYPNIKIVARQGATVFDDGQKVGEALLQRHPDLGGVFASWQDPAMGVVAAAKTLSRRNVNIATVDMSDAAALEVGTCGLLKASAVQLPYDEGVAEAIMVAKILAGEQPPKYVVTDVPVATHDNVLDVYKQAFHKDPPAKLKSAYRSSC